MYWKGGTREGALAGLLAGFALWAYTLMLPSIAKSGWWQPTSSPTAPGAWPAAPEQLLGLPGLDNLTHSLFWSLLANMAPMSGVSLWRAALGREASQALLFVDVFERTATAQPGVLARPAEVADLLR
jgi:Na+/proline symporter